MTDTPHGETSGTDEAALPRHFSTLASHKLNTLSAIVARNGELLYQRRFGMRIAECHILGVVAHSQPVTLRQACLEAGIDKGQGSRLVTRLLQAGLLARRDDTDDQRSFHLLLTPQGRELNERIAAEAVARNEVWMEGLPADKREVFIECLDVLTQRALAMRPDEQPAALQAPREVSWRPVPLGGKA